MNDNLLIETKEIGNHRIKIYYDAWGQSPITNSDMAARYMFEYNDCYHHILHEECNWKDWFLENRYSLEDALRYMAADVVKQKDIITYYKKGEIDGLRFIYDRHEREWKLQTWEEWLGDWFTRYEVEPYDLKKYDCRSELVECLSKDELISLIQDCAKDFVIKEWSTTGYSQGDFVKGVAYISKERYDKMVGDTGKPWKEHADYLIDLEVKEIGMWMWGDVIGYVLEKKVPFTKVYDDENREDEEDIEWEEVGSCWGFFMETEELIDEVISEYSLKSA